MNGQYPLSDSQRESLNHLNCLNEGEVLAVSGPPGTGKTTLLQSIVANKFVDHALREIEPPVILAASTNNQAVTNIIDSFGAIVPIGIANLEKRWLGDHIYSFAVYFPSGQKAKDAENKGYQYIKDKESPFVQSIDDENHMEAARKVFLDECGKYFQKKFGKPKECEAVIHSRLEDLNSVFQECVDIFELIREIIGEDSTFAAYRGKLEKQIDKLEDERLTQETLRQQLAEEVLLFRTRLEQWRQEYRRLPFYVRTLKALPFFRRKVVNAVTLFKTPEESVTMAECRSFAEVEDCFAESIERINLKIHVTAACIQQLEADISDIERQDSDLLKLRERCLVKFERMETLGVDLSENDEKKLSYLHELDITKINELFDIRLRYIMFWLAAHYYECKWVLKENYPTEKQRGKDYANVLNMFYHRLALIAPCMVGTCYKLPSKFKAYDKNDKVNFYLYDFADLLIIDEAGQVSPEVAAPMFSLAKRAIIVGDEHQIPPVWGTSRALDITFARQEGIIQNDRDFDALAERGLCCSESSVMRAAANACKYEKYDNKGLFLSEHRRCYDEIINYCNELVYNKRLIPLRGNGNKDYPFESLPHMGHRDMDTGPSTKVGGSRANADEASSIVDWIRDNYDTIEKAYRKSFPEIKDKEILGIVTPFKAQASLIRKTLGEKLPELKSNIEIGTVHVFQGAERRIIILSTTYGPEDGCYFIDRNKSLMNVAVSRAKDAFLIFGSRACLSKDESSASGLLRKLTDATVPDKVCTRI
jgi:hypothetical protein